MQCYQWKNRKIVLSTHLIEKVLKSRRASKALEKLLPLFETSLSVKITYSELAKLIGYKTRSGALKAIRILEGLGVVVRTNDGYLHLTMGDVLLIGVINE